MTFREFADLVRGGAEHVALTRLEGDRDLTPMLHLESELGISTSGVDPWFFASPEGTQLLTERFVLPAIRENEARKVAWTFGAWAAPAEDERPAQHPDRREILLVTVIDPEVVEHWAARIVRTGSSVVVGSWTPSQPNVGGGPVITTIQEALR